MRPGTGRAFWTHRARMMEPTTEDSTEGGSLAPGAGGAGVYWLRVILEKKHTDETHVFSS